MSLGRGAKIFQNGIRHLVPSLYKNRIYKPIDNIDVGNLGDSKHDQLIKLTVVNVSVIVQYF